MNNKLKKITISALALAVLTFGGTYAISRVAADDVSNIPDFISHLAEKLGIDSAKLQTAVDETRSEIRDQRVDSAVEAGDLTQEQADLLEKIAAYRVEHRESQMEENREEMHEQMQNLSKEERQVEMQEHQQELLSQMSEDLGISEATIQDTQDAARDAHIAPLGGRGGFEGGMMGGEKDGQKQGFGSMLDL